ncbi:MAG: hypothetical protein CVU50_05820 [Candidatus Cloacimonetes bacterium HGW-Cloacimonetes-3]|nr:MAG: hypothetical protein CVU50_05820 [Candidatus Cloacimonetes bacterium HGW-Cloacimonetes-3]
MLPPCFPKRKRSGVHREINGQKPDQPPINPTAKLLWQARAMKAMERRQIIAWGVNPRDSIGNGLALYRRHKK